MSWIFGLPKADWTLELYTPIGNPGDYYSPAMSWILRVKNTGELLRAYDSPYNYNENIKYFKTKYSFRDLTSEDWRMLKDKQEVYAANKEHEQKLYEAETAPQREAANKARDEKKAKQLELKKVEDARQLEIKKSECRALLATGGRRRTKKAYRKKINKKKSRRHR